MISKTYHNLHSLQNLHNLPNHLFCWSPPFPPSQSADEEFDGLEDKEKYVAALKDNVDDMDNVDNPDIVNKVDRPGCVEGKPCGQEEKEKGSQSSDGDQSSSSSFLILTIFLTQGGFKIYVKYMLDHTFHLPTSISWINFASSIWTQSHCWFWWHLGIVSCIGVHGSLRTIDN